MTPRTAVITGGGTGIGAACAQALAADCRRLVLIGRRPERLAESAAAITDLDATVEVHTRPADLADLASVASLCTWLREELGSIDILVNNAGSPQPPIGDDLASVAEVWTNTWRANTLSAVLITEGLLPIIARPGGRIIMISSFAAALGTGSPAYASAKGALETYVVTLMRRLGPEGITVNAVAPGFTDGTELVAGRIPPERRERLLSGIAARRPGTPEEIASLVAYLASPEAGFVNGQTITANGGTYLPG